MKLLFLDIDGVVNTARSMYFSNPTDHFQGGSDSELIDRNSAHAIRRIVERTGCRVVINSTHGGFGEDHIREMFLRVDYDISEDLCMFGWRTEFPHNEDNRVEAVRKYLEMMMNIEQVTHFVIIDDSDLFQNDEFKDNHVFTRSADGILFDDYLRACEILGNGDKRAFLI